MITRKQIKEDIKSFINHMRKNEAKKANELLVKIINNKQELRTQQITKNFGG